MKQIDNYLAEILDLYDGFNCKSTLTFEQARVVMAKYAMDCMHDSRLAKEAMKVCEENP